MSKLAQQFKRQGDKKNSDFFEESIEKIYSQKEQTGLQEMIEKIAAVMIQVQTGDLTNFLTELYIMTPYRFHKGFITKHHKIIILKNIENTPDYIVMEPLSENYKDKFTALNMVYPRGAEKPNARYLGEIFKVQDLKSVVKTLDSEQIRFQDPTGIKNEFLNNEHFRISDISYFTNNVIAYTENELNDWESLNIGESFELSHEEKSLLDNFDEKFKEFEFDQCVLGLDHLATRVLCNDREYALLEFLSMTNYYLWGAYNIEEMNSSTNVTRKYLQQITRRI